MLSGIGIRRRYMPSRLPLVAPGIVVVPVLLIHQFLPNVAVAQLLKRPVAVADNDLAGSRFGQWVDARRAEAKDGSGVVPKAGGYSLRSWVKSSMLPHSVRHGLAQKILKGKRTGDGSSAPCLPQTSPVVSKDHRRNNAINNEYDNVLPINLITQKFQASATVSSSGAKTMWHSNLPLLRQGV